MRVLRTSLAARTLQKAQSISEEKREDDRDHDEPGQWFANPRLKCDKEEGDEDQENEAERESEDEKRLVHPSVEPRRRMAEWSGI